MILNKTDCVNLFNLLARAEVKGLEEAQVLCVLGGKLQEQVRLFDAPTVQKPDVPQAEPTLDIPTQS